MPSDKKVNSPLRRTAAEIKNYRRFKRIIPAAIGLVAAFLAIVYVIALIFDDLGSFTISVSSPSDAKYSLSLDVSDTIGDPTSKLNFRTSAKIQNISRWDLPKDLNDNGGVEYGELMYIKYTFFLKNNGEECSYKFKLNILKQTKGVEEAVRVRVYYTPDYYNPETGDYNYGNDYLDYAKPQYGKGGLPERDPDEDQDDDPDEADLYEQRRLIMNNFESDATVMTKWCNRFAAGGIAKFTVVLWLEGSDPQCHESYIAAGDGCEFKLAMSVEAYAPRDDS